MRGDEALLVKRGLAGPLNADEEDDLHPCKLQRRPRWCH
jgi:hypothetical protein